MCTCTRTLLTSIIVTADTELLVRYTEVQLAREILHVVVNRMKSLFNTVNPPFQFQPMSPRKPYATLRAAAAARPLSGLSCRYSTAVTVVRRHHGAPLLVPTYRGYSAGVRAAWPRSAMDVQSPLKSVYYIPRGTYIATGR